MCDLLGISACIDEWDPDWDERCGSCLVEPQRWCYLEWRDVLNGLTSKDVYCIETICRIIEIVPLIFLTIGATFLALVGNSLNLMSALFCCSSSGPARRGSTDLIKMPWATQQKKSVRLKELSEDEVRREFRTHLKPLIEKEMDPKLFSKALAHKDRHADPVHHLPNDSTHWGWYNQVPTFYYPISRLQNPGGTRSYVAQVPLKNSRWKENLKDFFDVLYATKPSHIFHLWRDLDPPGPYLPEVGKTVNLDGAYIFSDFSVSTQDQRRGKNFCISKVLLKRDKTSLEITNYEIYYDSISPEEMADFLYIIYSQPRPQQIVFVDKNGWGTAGVFVLAYLIFDESLYTPDSDLILKIAKRLLCDETGRRGLITCEQEYLLVYKIVHHMIKKHTGQ